MKIGTMVEFDVTNKMGYGAKPKKSNMAATFKDGRHSNGSDIVLVHILRELVFCGKYFSILY